MAKRNSNWRYKYPPCPDCKAIGIDGLTMTRLGHLRCRSCNAMFTWKYGRNFNIKIVKSMGD